MTVSNTDHGDVAFDSPNADLVQVRDEIARFEALREKLRWRRTELLAEATKIGEILGDDEDVVLNVPPVRRTQQGLRTGLTGDIETYIEDHPECTLNDIHEALGVEKAKITNTLVRWKREGRVRTGGERRSYTYSMVKSR